MMTIITKTYNCDKTLFAIFDKLSEGSDNTDFETYFVTGRIKWSRFEGT